MTLSRACLLCIAQGLFVRNGTAFDIFVDVKDKQSISDLGILYARLLTMGICNPVRRLLLSATC